MRRLVVAICAILALASTQAAPASAESLGKIGQIPAAGGAGAGALAGPRTVAVNRTGAGGVTAGDVYVLDNNNRVSELSADGSFVRAFGYDVVSSGEHDAGVGPEICEAVSSPTDVCKAGVANALAGGLSNAQGIAVDQGNGNVYVYEVANRRVSVFSAKGVFEGAFGWKVKAGAEAAAELQFCTTAGTGCQAGESTASAGGFATNTATPRNLALDAGGNLYVPDAGNRRIEVFSPTLNGSGEVTGVSFVRAVGAGEFSASNPTSVAVDSVGAIYAVSTSSGGACSSTAPCRIQKFNADGTIADANFGPDGGECPITETAGFFVTGPSGRGVIAAALDPATDNLYVLRRVLAGEAQVCAARRHER